MKNPIAGNEILLRAITNKTLEVIDDFMAGRRSYEEMGTPLDQYQYFMIDRAGWIDIIEQALGKEMFTQLWVYYDYLQENVDLYGQVDIPDSIITEAIDKAEIARFSRVVSI